MSTKQIVNTVVVQDYEYDSTGQPLGNQEVTLRLAPAELFIVAAGAAGNASQVDVQQTEVRVKSDANGFWSANLVSNNVITPAGTYYTVKVGLLKQYQIAIPAGAGPFIASNILTGPLPVFPQGSSVAGPITITGNLTVTGAGTFSGALAANAGLTVLGGGNVSGGLTVAGLLTMSDAVSRLVPGATSFSVRNHANTLDNLIVTDAGNVTALGNLTVAGGPLTVAAGGASVTGGITAVTGDLVATAGRLVLNAAAAKIKGGATSLSLRNNADSADNVLIADAGGVTLRNPALSMPASVGGTIPATSAGTVPVKFDDQAPTGSSYVTPTIPGTFRLILITYKVRTTSGNGVDVLNLQLNGDTGAHYDYTQYSIGAAFNSSQTPNASSIGLGQIPGGASTAGQFARGTLEVFAYTDTASRKGVRSQHEIEPSGLWGCGGSWQTQNAAITTVTLLASVGNFAPGSLIIVELFP